MFDADSWAKEYHHKDVCARVYKDETGWRFEYETDGMFTVGMASTSEVAMQRIEDYLKVGIAIRKRKRSST
jgi:hypothetical protein